MLLTTFNISSKAVEAVLIDLAEVNACAVLVLGEEGEDKYLVAYVVPENKEITKKNIRAEMKKRLPFYMIPSYFIFLDRHGNYIYIERVINYIYIKIY